MAGGDYYDVFTLDDNHIVLLVGDASGHGMKAAMSIMVMHTLVRMIRTHRYQNTAAFVAEINNQLCQHSVVNEEGGFITLCYGLLQLDTNELQWTSAGHPIPLVQDLTTGIVRALEADTTAGLPLAIYPDMEYDTFTVRLPEAYRLLFYTDGLQEAFPEHKPTKTGEFGVDGISRTLQSQQQTNVNDALQALFDNSEAYTEGSGRHDDTSVVLLERRRGQVAN
jgi:serine phosphatase RsbU (regulator of sigma subunit)